MPIKDLPLDAQPREKLAQRGAGALSDAELLAVVLRTGMAGKSVLQMAEELLALPGGGGLAGLLAATHQDLGTIKGLGPAKRAELLAVLELARRTLAAEMARRPVFDSPQAVRDFLRLELAELGHEVFAVLFLDAQHRLIRFEPMFRGTLTQTSVYPREVLKRALALDAAAVILAHNHPSGVAEPSKADEFLTQSLKTALQMIDVRVLDHFVVGRGPVVSFAERGLL